MVRVWPLFAVSAALGVTAVGLAQGSPRSVPDFDYRRMDSLVLERPHDPYTLNPSYRITITRAGEVRYVPGPRAPRRATTAPLAPEAFQILIAHAEGVAFAQLPDTIMRDPRFCPFVRSDAATVIVVLYLPDRAKRVVNYHGCPWTPAALRDFEEAIERAAGVEPYGRPR